MSVYFFFFQAEDGIRDLVRSRGLGDVYKRQVYGHVMTDAGYQFFTADPNWFDVMRPTKLPSVLGCLLYTSDAADERSSVDLGGRRIIKKNKRTTHAERSIYNHTYTAAENYH